VNRRFQQLIKELGEAINGSLAESDQIAEVVSRIKAEGYDIFLVLEATIGFNKQDETEGTANVVSIHRESAEPNLKMTSQDVKFLKSLRIDISDAA
jgi:hypothetical protein